MIDTDEGARPDFPEDMDIRAYLPHRYPFLLVDRVVEVTPGKSIVGLKNVSINEPFFMGHFPRDPVMPGVLIIEALAQVSGVLVLKSRGLQLSDSDVIYHLAGLEKVRFKKVVRPGDQLLLHAELLTLRKKIAKFQTVATVAGEQACVADITCFTAPA